MVRPRRGYALSCLIILAVVALSPFDAQKQSRAGQNASDKPEQKQWSVDRTLALTPVPETVPALKYRLFPLNSDLKEGNAVPIYLRLVHERNDDTMREWKEKPVQWNKL